MKFFKIIVINILIFAVCFFALDIYAFIQNGYTDARLFFANITKLPVHNFDNALRYAAEGTPINSLVNFRKRYIDTSNQKAPIVLFGCSFTYGAKLKDTETFSYQLNKITKRNVYNLGICSCGVQHMLYMLRDFDYNNKFTKLLPSPKQPPKCIIYTFISDHIYRLHKACLFFDPKLILYKYEKAKLKLLNDRELYWWHSYFLRNIVTSYVIQKVSENFDKKDLFLLEHFLEANDEIKKYYPDTEFIIFVYEGDKQIKLIEEDLKKANIKTVYLSELSDINFNDSKYIVDEYNHPSKEAWEVIVPLLVKKLKL